MLITTSEVAERLGLRPLARIHTATVVGSDPLYMLTGVIPATEKVLHRAGLTLADIDLFEVNEAFAPVVLAWAHDTGADLAKTNVNGGAIAIGHPLGASGARIMTTMVNALEQRGGRYALQTMCEAAAWPTPPSSSGCNHGPRAGLRWCLPRPGFSCQALCNSNSGMTRDVFDWYSPKPGASGDDLGRRSRRARLERQLTAVTS